MRLLTSDIPIRGQSRGWTHANPAAFCTLVSFWLTDATGNPELLFMVASTCCEGDTSGTTKRPPQKVEQLVALPQPRSKYRSPS